MRNRLRLFSVALILSLAISLAPMLSATAAVPALVAPTLPVQTSANNQNPGDFVPGEILVKFKPLVDAIEIDEIHRLIGGQKKGERTPSRITTGTF